MSKQGHIRLFIPGPVEVRREILAAQTRPLIGHRSQEYAELHARVIRRLQPLFGTEGRVFVVTSSGSGLQEAAVRNTVARRCLCLVNGAFGARWHEVTLSNGKPAEALEVPWGRAIRAEPVGERLRRGDFDAVTLVLNETSTGVLNPLPEIAQVVRQHPEVMLLVDAVSAAGGAEIQADAWGVDVCLTSSQKALALPPGLALCSVSDRAMERARSVPHRGWYFDFLQYEKYQARNHTPATPAISLMQALDAQLDAVEREGWSARFGRHRQLMSQVHRWSESNGFELFAEAGYRSPTVTALCNTPGIDVGALNAFLRRRGFTISDGYGKLKGQTLRIAHMGDVTEDELSALLESVEDFLKER